MAAKVLVSCFEVFIFDNIQNLLHFSLSAFASIRLFNAAASVYCNVGLDTCMM